MKRVSEAVDVLSNCRVETVGLLTTQRVHASSRTRKLSLNAASIAVKDPGELTNEDQTIVGGKATAGFSIEGHDSKEDGVLARVLASKATAPDGANVYARSRNRSTAAGLPGMRSSKGLGGAA